MTHRLPKPPNRHTAHARLTDARTGQGLVEYALIILLIAIAMVTATSALGQGLIAAYERIAAAIPK